MNDLSNKKVGDKVFDALGGAWEITEFDLDSDFCLRVVSDNNLFWITSSGGVEEPDAPPMFFPEPVRVIPAQGECDFSGYQTDDVVYLRGGRPLTVRAVLEDGMTLSDYLFAALNGKDKDGEQIIFHAPPNLVPSNPDAFKVPQHIAERKKPVDWSQVPIDTLVYADTVSGTHLRYFAGLRDGKLTYWRFGASSLTVEDDTEWGVAFKMRLAKDGEGL